MCHRELTRLRRIGLEVFGLENAGGHASSVKGLPCE